MGKVLSKDMNVGKGVVGNKMVHEQIWNILKGCRGAVYGIYVPNGGQISTAFALRRPLKYYLRVFA